jgi:MFS family permease
VLAVVIITIGEMIVMPTSQALAAGFARLDMRGRYMAVFGLSHSVPAAAGPLAAGLVLDNYAPNLGEVVCAISATSFYALHLKLGAQPRFAPVPVESNERRLPSSSTLEYGDRHEQEA